MTHHALDFDKLAAGAFKAFGIVVDPVGLRDLPAYVSELFLAEVCLAVVLQAHGAFELRRESDMAQARYISAERCVQ